MLIYNILICVFIPGRRGFSSAACYLQTVCLSLIIDQNSSLLLSKGFGPPEAASQTFQNEDHFEHNVN